MVNQDWIEPFLNKDYAEWAEHNHTVIMPAKVRKPKMKSSVENAVGILESNIFHTLAVRQYFSLEQFTQDLWAKLEKLNHVPFKKKPHDRYYYWMEEKEELLPLPAVENKFMERRIAKVSTDFHVRFDKAYYSVDKACVHQQFIVAATERLVRISSKQGSLLAECPVPNTKANGSQIPTIFRLISRTWLNGTPASLSGKQAMTIGPHTTEVIQRILKCRKLEVQTYRMCQGVLSFSNKYSKEAVEKRCESALSSGKVSYN